MVYKALLAARSPPRLKRWRPVVRPEFTGSGATPHRWANAASFTSRFGLSPAVTSNCPATSVPTPSSATSRGAVLATTTVSAWSSSAISWLSNR